MHGIFLSALVSQRDTALCRPLGPYRVASYLRHHGYEIQVIDFIHALDKEQIVALVKRFITSETKFIGLGFMVDYLNSKFVQITTKLADTIRILKQEFPNIKFIMGGSTGFRWSYRYKNGELFDYIVKGYGEDQTLALFDHYYKKQSHPPFEIVDGNKHLSEHLTINKAFNFTESRHLWHTRDCIQPGEALPIEFARGCIFKCSFCKYPHIGKHKNDYTKHIECIKDELISNYNNFGTDTYFITDDTFNADKDFIKAFTIMSKALPFKLKYSAFIRPDLLEANVDQADMFAENGLASAFFGIESFQEDNAKMVGKPWSAKRGKDYLSNLYHNKWNKSIHLSLGFIAGLPYETLDDLRNTNKWLVENQMTNWMWHPLHVALDSNYYKSEFELNAQKNGFTFKVIEGKSIWENKVCNQNLAVEWIKELQNDVKEYQTPSSWTLVEFSSYGYDLNALKTTRNIDIDWLDVHNRGKNLLIKYFNQLTTL
jgi:radical SAM superfamily enzyme